MTKDINSTQDEITETALANVAGGKAEAVAAQEMSLKPEANTALTMVGEDRRAMQRHRR